MAASPVLQTLPVAAVGSLAVSAEPLAAAQGGPFLSERIGREMQPGGAVEPSNTLDWATLLSDLIDKFRAAEDASRYTREAAERDIDYDDHKQLTEDEVRELKKRGQPPVVRNKIRTKVNYLLGLEQSMRTDPRALPRTPQHEDDAHSCTDALRFVADQARYPQTRSRSFRDIVRAGWGGVEVRVEEAGPGRNPRIIVERTPWDRMFWDPFSAEDDFSDASYLGLILWMDRKEAIRRFGDDAGQVFDETVNGDIGGTYDDKPREWTWRDGKRHRVRVIQAFYRDDAGVWNFCEFTGGGILNAGPSPWLDDDGEPEHGFVWRTAYRDRSNNPYGEIRGFIDTQDEINKRASKALHAINARQTFGTEGSLGKMTVREMRQEMAKPDGHISLRAGLKFGESFGMIPTTDIVSGNLQMLEVAMGEMQVLGPNAAMQGKGASSASGRSILAQQQGGSIEAQGLFDTLRDMDHEVYRKVWRRIRQFWTAEDWIRVTDDERNLRWVGINAAVPDPMTGQPMVPKPLAAIDVDIIVDDAPHVGTLVGEQFQGMVELAKISPELQQLPAEVWIGMSQMRDKANLIQKVQEARQQRSAEPSPEQVAAIQAELENTNADTAQKAATALLREAQAAKEAVGVMYGEPQAQAPQQPSGSNVIPFGA